MIPHLDDLDTGRPLDHDVQARKRRHCPRWQPQILLWLEVRFWTTGTNPVYGRHICSIALSVNPPVERAGGGAYSSSTGACAVPVSSSSQVASTAVASSLSVGTSSRIGSGRVS